MNLETYLISKKIDSVAFLQAEPELWNTWNAEIESLHPNSFTAQKLYLINPIRRKYPLKSEPIKAPELKMAETSNTQVEDLPAENKIDPIQTTPTPKPGIPRPVFKPKPKIQ